MVETDAMPMVGEEGPGTEGAPASQCQAGTTDEVAIGGHRNEEAPRAEEEGKLRAIKRKYLFTQQVARAQNLLLCDRLTTQSG